MPILRGRNAVANVDRPISIAAVLLACALTLAARPACAWKQYHTSTGAPMRWPAKALQQPVGYGIDETGLTGDGIAPDALSGAVQSSLAQWQDLRCPGCATSTANGPCDGGPCQDRAFGVTFAPLGWQPALPIGLGCSETKDGVCVTYAPNGNQITFVHDAKDWNFGTHVIAMTVISAKTNTGFIGDADIAVNDAGFAFCLDACGPGQLHFGAVVLHEAGHFIGLDHSDVPAAIMYATPPKIIDRIGTLHADDRAGACAAYPGEVTATCAPASAAKPNPQADAAGCSGSPPGPDAAPAVLLVSALILGLRARRASARVR